MCELIEEGVYEMPDPEITYSADIELETMEFFVDGEYFTTWSYYDSLNDALDEFKRIYLAGYNQGRKGNKD